VSELHQTNCLTCEIKVLDFTEFKTTFFSTIQDNSPKAVNAMFFPNEELILIDMASYYFTLPCTPENFNAIQSGESGIKVKINGTISTIVRFLNHYLFDENYIAKFSTSKYKTILLTEMNDIDYLRMKMANLDTINIFQYGEIAIFTCEMFQNAFHA
jgi:hypothetical protein